MKLLRIIISALIGLTVAIIAALFLNIRSHIPFPLTIVISVLVSLVPATIILLLRRRKDPTKGLTLDHLPADISEFIENIVKKMRYSRKARADVKKELTGHFEDELADCRNEQERQKIAERIVQSFGDAKTLARLMRRAKKRCRPLWKKTLIRAVQSCGVLVVFFLFYSIWFITGSPSPSVDYFARLNQLVRPAVSDQQNAWNWYEKAVELYSEPNDAVQNIQHSLGDGTYDITSLNASDKALVKQWLNRNQPAWEQFTIASTKPYCFREYSPDPNDEEKLLIGLLVPHLATIRDLARMGVYQAHFEIEENRLKSGLDNLLTPARVGSHWQQNNGILIYQLVGMSISSLAHQQIIELSAEYELSQAQLHQLQDELLSLYPGSYPLIDFRAEKLCFLDIVQHVFTEGGPGGGHLVPKKLANVIELNEESEAAQVFAASMLHARRDQTVAKYEQIYERLAKRAKMTPYQSMQQMNQENIVKALPMYRYFLIRYWTLALDRVCELAFHTKAMHEATLTVVALQRYKQQNSKFPAELDEVIEAGLLEKLPLDPYSNGSLVYRRTDESFTLYSVGEDFVDDNGKVVKDEKGNIQPWPESGDAVFWPVITEDKK